MHRTAQTIYAVLAGFVCLLFLMFLFSDGAYASGRKIVRDKHGNRVGTIVDDANRSRIYDRHNRRIGTIERRETVSEAVDRKNRERRERSGDDEEE